MILMAIREAYIETLNQIKDMVIDEVEDWVIIEYIVNKLIQLDDTDTIKIHNITKKYFE
jgi:hypothetical protein